MNAEMPNLFLLILMHPPRDGHLDGPGLLDCKNNQLSIWKQRLTIQSSLQAAYTLTGYGMVASMCEEVQNPDREVPKAMVLSVAAAGFTGIIYLIPILFVLPDVSTLLSVANGQPIGLIFKTATGSAGGGFALLFLILGILLFAGVGSLTAASRCTYAFARDGAIPGSGLWSRVDKRFDIPLLALVLSTLVDCVLGMIYFGSTSAFNAFTGVATICLSVSYGIPILVSLIRGRKAVRHSTYSLGKFGFAINVATIIWIVLAIVLFCMPTAIPVTPKTMNYASVVFMGFAMISLIWYIIRGRKTFTGPPVPVDVEAERTEHDGEAVGGFGKFMTSDNSEDVTKLNGKERKSPERVL
jgi:amino acid transporter